MKQMNEIPRAFVRANQAGIVLMIVLASILQQPILIAALWAVQVITLWRGLKVNLFVQLASPFLRKAAMSGPTEAMELTRFNNSIAVGMLTCSMLAFWLDRDGLLGYLFAGIVAVAALVALCGFCVGCFLYYQYKRLRR
ncbi:DUF4395 domain-containing protein [Paenibacillus sp. YYML68]|uniref:DUF4395 domain-containing protein n=1 Tax=Paenibacillus sp. YYML68 TaxID=2909250 RepID=UPI002490AA78|nr:DUF4395 domain-containing protein [Paenibacillus sp. YYML68]